jgi:hypothetical protein
VKFKDKFGGQRRDADIASQPAAGATTIAARLTFEGEAATRCIRRRAIRVLPPEQGLAGRVLHARFLGDLAVLEIAAVGFERPLVTLVREGEEAARGAEISIAVDPTSVLVFPAEPSQNYEAELIDGQPETA